ncbi:uncharacterized protein [Drosophila takahashii]|uniref:uncharacterized protein n=1 Tax=Drosophila takahashii TaxID=29030 RepID=UPI001CF89490|nr:uncharacterized protein LOC108066977 [Drosophila takahashii]
MNDIIMDKNYKISERDLDIRLDLEFVDSLLKDLRLEVEPQARGVILDLAYTLARDKLVEAKRFANLANRTNVSVEDLEMTILERTDELKRRPAQQPLKFLPPNQASLPSPTSSRGLLLPTWRHCQVGMMAELKDPEPAQANPRIGVAPAPTVPGRNNPSSSGIPPKGSAIPGCPPLLYMARPGGPNTSTVSPAVVSKPVVRPSANPCSTSGIASGRPGMALKPGSSSVAAAVAPRSIPPAMKRARMQK